MTVGHMRKDSIESLSGRLALFGSLAAVALVVALCGCQNRENRREGDHQIAKLRAERDEALRQVDRKKAEIEALKARTDEILADRNELADRVTSAEQQRDAASKALDRMANVIGTAVFKTGMERRDWETNPGHPTVLEREVNSLLAQYESLQVKNRSLEVRNKALEAGMVELRQANESLRQQLEQVARRPPTTGPETHPDDRPDVSKLFPTP
jgi:Tfp pilus assembly protein PilN